MILGSLALLLIGVLLGIVGHAYLLEVNSRHTVGGGKEGRLDGVGLAKSGKHWLSERAADVVGTLDTITGEIRKREITGYRKNVDFSSVSPETTLAIEELASAVVRDYVRSVGSYDG